MIVTRHTEGCSPFNWDDQKCECECELEVRYLALLWALPTPQTVLAVALDWELYPLITKTVIQV